MAGSEAGVGSRVRVIPVADPLVLQRTKTVKRKQLLQRWGSHTGIPLHCSFRGSFHCPWSPRLLRPSLPHLPMPITEAGEKPPQGK